MLTSPFSPWRSVLKPQEALDLASINLENARKAKSSVQALSFCNDAETALARIRTSVRKTHVSSSRAEDRVLCNEIATIYSDLGKMFDGLGRRSKAQASNKNEEKWGGRAQLPGQSSRNSDNFASPPAADTAFDTLPLPPAPPPAPPHHSQIPGTSTRDIVTIPPYIFAKDMDQPPDINKLPKLDGRLENIFQLVHCLSLIQPTQLNNDTLDQSESDWLKAIEHDTDEHERLRKLAINILEEFTHDELKNANIVAEVVCLAPVLQKHELQKLLLLLVRGIEQSELLDFDLLEGLAQLVQSARPGHLNADNLVKILGIISSRLRNTHDQSPDYKTQLTLTVSRVLDAMADTKIKGLDRENLHAPLATYLHKLQGDADPHLAYQATYASQALLYVPDDETLWQATQRRTGKVVKGVAGLVSAVKGLDLNQFVESLSHIQEGLAGAVELFEAAKSAYEDASELVESTKQSLEYLNDGLSFSRKRAWYPALRGADVLLRNGQLIDFKRLVCRAPCRRIPLFQWGICQRLGELAANAECDDDSRASAVAFLGEMYQNDNAWGYHTKIKQLILEILMQLSTSYGREAQAAKALLQELERNGDGKKQELYRVCLEDGPGAHPLKAALLPLFSMSLLDRVQNNPDAETRLRHLKVQRLEERGKSVYISPQAKANLKASDDTLFPLMEKVKEFLGSERKVFLVLGDSGAGKSTFNQELEYDLWSQYKKNIGRIPLFITLAGIQNPEHDMVAKQLQKKGFTEYQIQELKSRRDLILICDGYDESRQTYNLYNNNQLNLQGGWRAQMVISCRSEYLGSDYRDRFQPIDRNRQAESVLFQEAVIAPFTKDQMKEYIEQFVSTNNPQWKADDYFQALDRIPGMKDLVTNPFLLALSLQVLPGMVAPGQGLSEARITRVSLYDEFVEQWLERGKIRLIEKASDQERTAFERLSDEGFTRRGVVYLTGLATAIFQRQSGSSVVEYQSFHDQGTWKEVFFGQEDETKLLREACPLKRRGNQYQFIHQSLLEYSLARAVFEPQKREREGSWMLEPAATATCQKNINSNFSYENHGAVKEGIQGIELPILESPLGRRRFVGEPSILRFLAERVQQEPLFKKQLLAVIERSKSETVKLETICIAAANAMTILIRSGMQFNGADLQGIRIPGADLSHGSFEFAQLQGANLRDAILHNTSFCDADLSGAQMAGIHFAELPSLEEKDEVEYCLYSPDGKTFAVGLQYGNISVYRTSDWEKTKTLSDLIPKIWSMAHLVDLEKKDYRYSLHNHRGVVSSIVYSPKGNLIASGNGDNTVRLWDVETGDCRHTLSGHCDYVSSVAYSPKGDLIASGSWDKTVRLWDVQTGECRHILNGHSKCVWGVVYSPKGDQIASGSWDKTLCLWDVETGECLHTLNSHIDYISSIVYSPRGDQIAFGGEFKIVRLWDVETGNCLHTLSGHSNSVSSIVFSPRGDQIASGSWDDTVRLWDVETGECRFTLSGHSSCVSNVVYSPKGDQIASGSWDNTVRLWDVETGECRHTLSGHSGSVWGLMYSPKGDQIASGSVDKTVRLWDVETGESNYGLSCHGECVSAVVRSPKGDRIASGSHDCTIRLWDAETGYCRHTLIGHSGDIWSVGYSPKGDQIASSSEDYTVRLWDVETGDCRHTLSGHSHCVTSVVYSPKGDLIASGCGDRTVRVWDTETGVCRHTLRGHGDWVKNVVYSPNGDLIASCSNDNTVRLWDVETGECRHTLSSHSKIMSSVVYSPKGDRIAFGSDDDAVQLWDVDTGDCSYTLSGHSRSVTIVVYSPKGDQIASGSWDDTVRLWDVRTGDCLHTLSGHSIHISSIMYSPKGNLIASGSWDKTVRLWDVASGECRVVVESYSEVSSISWGTTFDDNYVVAGCKDGAMRLWRVMEKGDECCARLIWRSRPEMLTLFNTSIQVVEGLSQPNKLLLLQRGAIGEPSLLQMEPLTGEYVE